MARSPIGLPTLVSTVTGGDHPDTLTAISLTGTSSSHSAALEWRRELPIRSSSTATSAEVVNLSGLLVGPSACCVASPPVVVTVLAGSSSSVALSSGSVQFGELEPRLLRSTERWVRLRGDAGARSLASA
jgi:hypothetical protein